MRSVTGALPSRHDLPWFLFPVITGLFLAALRWKTYGVVNVDFGQEMTAAWSITEGKHLYTDIAYFKGPLSPHFNALLLWLFGVSLRTIFVVNICIAVAIAYEILTLARRACGLPVSSFLACVFLIVFGFSVDKEYNNFNFVSPFVHELTHGTALSLLTLLALDRWQKTGRTREALLAGAAYGLVWLTRIEVSVALTAACAAWMWCRLRAGTPRRLLLRGAAESLASAGVVIAIAVLALSRTMPRTAALASAFATLHALLSTSVSSSPFFLHVGGWDHPFAALGFQIAALLVVILWLLFFFAAVDHWNRNDRLMGTIFAVMGMFTVFLLARRVLPLLHGTFLTLSTFGITAVAIYRVHTRGTHASPWEQMTVVMGVFALVMLGKIALQPSIRYYGFVHAMPAYLLFMAVLLTAVPHMVRRTAGEKGARIFLLFVVLTMGMEVGGKARIDQVLSSRKTIPIGAGADAFFVSDTSMNRPFAAFLQKAPELIPTGSTLTAIPEGAMVNYLLRLPLGIPVLNMMRTEYYIFGKDRMEGELFARRPDFILITHKDTSVFGLPLYGKMPEYGADVMAWLAREYEQIALFGEQPLTHPESEGVALWRRKDFRFPQSPQDVPSLR